MKWGSSVPFHRDTHAQLFRTKEMPTCLFAWTQALETALLFYTTRPEPILEWFVEMTARDTIPNEDRFSGDLASPRSSFPADGSPLVKPPSGPLAHRGYAEAEWREVLVLLDPRQPQQLHRFPGCGTGLDGRIEQASRIGVAAHLGDTIALMDDHTERRHHAIVAWIRERDLRDQPVRHMRRLPAMMQNRLRIAHPAMGDHLLDVLHQCIPLLL